MHLDTAYLSVFFDTFSFMTIFFEKYSFTFNTVQIKAINFLDENRFILEKELCIKKDVRERFSSR